MSFAAINGRVIGALSGRWKVSNLKSSVEKSRAPSKRILLLAAILIVIQILDGVFTGMGVVIYGSSIEANPIIRALIDSWGVANALVFVKALAVFIVFGLVMLSSYVNWMERAMKTVICIYMISALIPWSLILIRHI